MEKTNTYEVPYSFEQAPILEQVPILKVEKVNKRNSQCPKQLYWISYIFKGYGQKFPEGKTISSPLKRPAPNLIKNGRFCVII